MKAYLINPELCAVEEVEHDGSLESIYQFTNTDVVDAARFNDVGDCVYIDDEGLLRPNRFFFAIDGYPQPLAGNGLVLGCNAEGDSQAPIVTLEWVRANTCFLERFAIVVDGEVVVTLIPYKGETVDL